MRFRLLRRLFSRKRRDERGEKSCAPALGPSPPPSSAPAHDASRVPLSSAPDAVPVYSERKQQGSSAPDHTPPTPLAPAEIVTTRTTGSPGRFLTAAPLPFELQLVVLRHLNVNADRQTFLALLRLSSWWEAAAKTLYRNIDISGDKLCHLLGDDPATPAPPITQDVRTPYAGNEIRLLAGIIRIIATDNPSLASRLQTVLNEEVTILQTKQRESLHSINLSPRMRLALSFIKRMNIHSLHSRATWHTKTVMKVLEEYWFYTFRDTLGNHSSPRFFAEGFSYGDSLPFYNPDRRGAGGLPLRFWVGARSFHHPEHGCPTEIPTGEWDESVADAHQFRTDGPEYTHPPCTVCGTKVDQDTRVFDCVFTKA
ncbi:uncharacterized protein LOC62_01G001024 [Vanrija pseudolonga]|uniref:Uncharacterized protein n=1 Tax=Vanrija pseudolonga TaxID=143232 RepID=A0AAF0Y4D9_9TREE|nr:hypothetical protein LOC62_01G001024 [Vanrija pseudolonga]